MNKRAFGVICANYDEQGFESLLETRTVASIPFGGRYRMVDFPLSAMVHAGITTVGLIMPHYYRSLIDHVGTGKPWSLDRKIDGLFTLPGSMASLEDSKAKIRLGDLIANHRYFERRPEDSYGIFMATSNIFNMDLKPVMEFHEKNGKPVTFICGKNKKGEKVSMHAACVSRELLLKIIETYKNQPYRSLADVLRKEVSPKDTNEYLFEGYNAEISNVEDYINASMDLLNPDIHNELFTKKRIIYTKTQDEAPAHYCSGSSVKNSLVAAGCRIEGSIENCIIFRNVTIEKGAVLKNCIVMQHSKVHENAKLSNCILDKYVHISKDLEIKASKNKPFVIPKNKRI